MINVNKLPLTKKVGEVDETEDKFSSWSGSHGYYRRPETTSDPFKTDNMRNGVYDQEAMQFNKTLCSTQREINKSQVEFKPKSGFEPKILNATTSRATFVDQRHFDVVLRERGTLSSFQESFDRIYDKTKPKNEERGDVYALPVKHVAAVVYDCVGSDCPEFIVDKFVELSSKNSVGGKISWARFSQLVPQMLTAVEAECKYRRELPALMVLMNRPRIEDKKLGYLGDLSSTYRDNFNTNKDISFHDHHEGFEYTKHVDSMNKKGFNNAAKILYAGTTKATYHLPGFKGHIPSNIRNSKKLEHSCGEDYHPVQNNLRLTQRGMGCVLGYTGHVPHETSGPRQERMTACDPRTTNGVSFTNTRAYL